MRRNRRGKAAVPPLLIEKNGPNHPWKISIWDGSSRKQITRRERGAARGLVSVSAVTVVISVVQRRASVNVAGLIDRNWEDDRGNVAVIRPEKRDPNREIHWPPPPPYLLPPLPRFSLFFIGWKENRGEDERRRRRGWEGERLPGGGV